jgi:uncharacterized membrane protein
MDETNNPQEEAEDQVEELDDTLEDEDEFDEETWRKQYLPGERINKVAPWLATIFSAFGLLVSFILSIDKIKILEDPAFVPSCNISPIISCGNVMKTWQSNVLGFPNSFIGLAAYGALLALSLAWLFGSKHSKIVKFGMAALAVGSALSSYWLIYQSLYVIGDLCPWCSLLWVTTTPLAWTLIMSVIRDNAEEKVANGKTVGSVTRSLLAHPALPVVIWLVVVLMMVYLRWSDYWMSLL